jgi:hypothetical protein
MSVTIAGNSNLVLQVVNTIKTNFFSATGTAGVAPYEVTGLSVTITPSSASSKILVIADVFMGLVDFNNYNYFWKIVRNSTDIGVGTAGTVGNISGGHNMYLSAGSIPFVGGNTKLVLDLPATTSATTYKVFIGADNSSGTVYINRKGYGTDYCGTSSITAMEIAA